MKVILLREARIKHAAGEVVDVSPAEYNFLISTKSAKPAVEAAPEKRRPLRRNDCEVQR